MISHQVLSSKNDFQAFRRVLKLSDKMDLLTVVRCRSPCTSCTTGLKISKDMKLDNQFKQDLRRMRKVRQVLRKMGKSLKSLEKNGEKV